MSIIKLIRTDSSHPEFVTLVKWLDEDLAQRNGVEQEFYDQFNKIDLIKQVIVAYEDDLPIGCGAIKKLSEDTMEVKRMFTQPAHRGKGIAAKVLQALEDWTYELGVKRCVLETGIRHYEAIALYIKSGYIRIPNYGQYKGIENSVCFEKNLVATDYTD